MGPQFGPRPVSALDTYSTETPRPRLDLLIAEVAPLPDPQDAQLRPRLRPVLVAASDTTRFACVDGSSLEVRHEDGGAQVSVSWNGETPVVLVRAHEADMLTYKSDAARFTRAGPRAAWRSAGSVTVAEGDTLSKIALRIYGSSARARDIAAANADKIDDPNLIFPGQVLRLPGVERSCRVTLANAEP